MPNYVMNSFVEVSQPNKLNNFIFNDEGEIDFNVLCPMPEELKLIDGQSDAITPYDFTEATPYFSYASQANNFEEYKSLIKTHFNIDIPNVKTQDELFKIHHNILKQLEPILEAYNYTKYGAPGWYDWRRNNWGTKWNVCDPLGYSFQTTWSAPIPWLRTLAKKCDFTLLYAEEDMGSNCGIIVAENRSLFVSNSPVTLDSAIAFSYCVWGYDIEDVNQNLEENAEEHIKYLQENRYILLEEFFRLQGCEDVFKRISKDLMVRF